MRDLIQFCILIQLGLVVFMLSEVTAAIEGIAP